MDVEIFFALTIVAIFFSGVHSNIFTIENQCPFTIWPAIEPRNGSPSTLTGFELQEQTSRKIDVPASWSGRVWARYGCSNSVNGSFTCESGDCGTGQILCSGARGSPPTTIVEFTLVGGRGQDSYDISLLDGFNLPVTVTPESGLKRGLDAGCIETSCWRDLNIQCPPELSVKGKDGQTIGCKSACLALDQPQYCCTGAYGTPISCKPTKYSQFFKTRCPSALTYLYDSKNYLFNCPGGPNYHITFCPIIF